MSGVYIWEGISGPLNNLDLVSKTVSQHDLPLPLSNYLHGSYLLTKTSAALLFYAQRFRIFSSSLQGLVFKQFP